MTSNFAGFDPDRNDRNGNLAIFLQPKQQSSHSWILYGEWTETQRITNCANSPKCMKQIHLETKYDQLKQK